MSRVLFVHARKDTPDVPMPHLGMAMLAAILRRAGHEAFIFDEVLYERDPVPTLRGVLDRVQPDIIGFSVYTSTLDRVTELMREARAACAAPILVGGPHATLFPEHLVATGLVDTVVCGEAEGAIVDVVATAQRRDSAVVVRAEPPDVAALPWPDYTACLDHALIRFLPLITSRGCPYLCSFCAVHRISTRRWRPRDPADCTAEVRQAVRDLPAVVAINLSDDCPTGRRDHFKSFLRLLIEADLKLGLVINNMRADRVDEELVSLSRQAGATNLCLGVESGNPEVFALVNKGETLDDIRRAAALITSGGLELGLCFVIGLPGDTYARHGDSVRLAKELGARLIFWNMAHPFPGTEMHRWFLERGASLDAPRTYTSYDNHALRCAEPVVSTPDFTKWERQRAYFLAVVETDQYVANLTALGDLLSGAVRYRLPGPVLRALVRRGVLGPVRRLKRWLGRAR